MTLRFSFYQVTAVAAAMAVFSLLGCGDGSSVVEADSPRGEDATTTTGLESFSPDDLRPEAVPLVDLTDPVDMLVVELYANEYIRESNLLAYRVARVKSLLPELASCLDDSGVVETDDASLLGAALIDSRFAFQGSNGQVVEVYPEESAAVQARGDLDPDAPSVAGSQCIEPVDSASALVYGGQIAVRAKELRAAGSWVQSESASESLVEALERFCPNVVDGTAQVCSDMAGYLAAVVDVHRAIVESNREGLEG